VLPRAPRRSDPIPSADALPDAAVSLSSDPDPFRLGRDPRNSSTERASQVSDLEHCAPLPFLPREPVSLGYTIGVEYVSMVPRSRLNGLIYALYYLDASAPYSRLLLPAAPS